MNHYGFSLIFGRPFPTEFLEWVHTHLHTITTEASWNEPENLHATLVNCTYPYGRSVETMEQALFCKDALKAKLINHLLPILHHSQPIRLGFTAVQCVHTTLILPSEIHGQVGQLKKALQGGQDFIPKDQATDRLMSPKAIGIDKFSADKSSLQATVAVTLGELTDQAHLGEFCTLPQAPTVTLSGLRIVFYCDRSLRNAVTSELLEFGAAARQEDWNRTRLIRFFEKVDGVWQGLTNGVSLPIEPIRDLEMRQLNDN